MCSGERIHEREIDSYLRATDVVRRVTRNCRRETASARRADAYLALWKLLVERLSGDDHARWCALLRGPAAALDAALLRTLRLRFLDEIRATDGLRRKVLPSAELPLANERVASVFYADAAGGGATLVEAREDARRLQDAVAALPENERLTIEAVDLEDLSFAEVGRRMGVGESTVRYWRSSGLKRLRETFGRRRRRFTVDAQGPHRSRDRRSPPK
ncbi:MAG: sigma-70 family RNA polymerase sigma factor [Polyangiaceae bacterium]